MRLIHLMNRTLGYVQACVASGLALAAFCAGRPGAGVTSLIAGFIFFLLLMRDSALDLQPLKQFDGELMDVHPAAVGASEIRALHGSQF